jgi:hypothetical protein
LGFVGGIRRLVADTGRNILATSGFSWPNWIAQKAQVRQQQLVAGVSLLWEQLGRYQFRLATQV